MGIPILITGKSGSGKSTALRNFDINEIALVNVSRKPLPFKKKFNDVLKSDSYELIEKYIKESDKNSIIIDDAGYLIVNQFMSGHTSCGSGNAIFSFYNKLADNFWNLIERVKDLAENKIVYVIMHESIDDFGNQKPKTIGKLLDDKVCIEGMFTVSLRALKHDTGYVFRTQTDGLCISKSPYQMFENVLVPNDLKKVDTAIREYYEI